MKDGRPPRTEDEHIVAVILMTLRDHARTTHQALSGDRVLHALRQSNWRDLVHIHEGGKS